MFNGPGAVGLGPGIGAGAAGAAGAAPPTPAAWSCSPRPASPAIGDAPGWSGAAPAPIGEGGGGVASPEAGLPADGWPGTLAIP